MFVYWLCAINVGLVSLILSYWCFQKLVKWLLHFILYIKVRKDNLHRPDDYKRGLYFAIITFIVVTIIGTPLTLVLTIPALCLSVWVRFSVNKQNDGWYTVKITMSF